ncbi:hypothetical protein LTR94_036040, partial [Friedmanniomyces endolithicus]
MVGDHGRLAFQRIARAPREEAGQACDDLAGRAHVIDQPGADRRQRHPVVTRGVRLLDDAHTAVFLHRAQARGAVRAGARQDHARRIRLPVDRQRLEEIVDRPAQPARLRKI